MAAANLVLPGSLHVDRASLGWFKPVCIEGVRFSQAVSLGSGGVGVVPSSASCDPGGLIDCRLGHCNPDGADPVRPAACFAQDGAEASAEPGEGRTLLAAERVSSQAPLHAFFTDGEPQVLRVQQPVVDATLGPSGKLRTAQALASARLIRSPEPLPALDILSAPALPLRAEPAPVATAPGEERRSVADAAAQDSEDGLPAVRWDLATQRFRPAGERDHATGRGPALDQVPAAGPALLGEEGTSKSAPSTALQTADAFVPFSGLLRTPNIQLETEDGILLLPSLIRRVFLWPVSDVWPCWGSPGLCAFTRSAGRTRVWGLLI